MINLKAKPFYLSDNDIEWVGNTLLKLNTKEKCGQLFCVLYGGFEDEINRISSVLQPGGGMFRPMPTELAISISKELRARSKVPMLIAANLEKGGNGIVEEGTIIGSPLEIAATNDEVFARKMGKLCADEAMAVGANWSFAPIVDVDLNYRNPITNTRTFGSDPKKVREFGLAYLQEIQGRGMAACIKHFPGDGVDERDQHLCTTINDLSCEEWDNSYGKIYSDLINAGAMTCMVGHIIQPAYIRRFNPDIKAEDLLPCSLSKELMTDLLRGQLQFNGLIITDATTMAGYTTAMSRRRAVPATIAAGADMFLFSRNLEEDFGYMMAGIEDGTITQERLDEAVTRVLATKAALGLHKECPEPVLENAKAVIGCERHKQWALECADKAITLVKEQPGILPLSPEKYKKILVYSLEPEAGGGGQYYVRPACDKFFDLLKNEGFNIDKYVNKATSEGRLVRFDEMKDSYDLIIYVANYTTRSNQTVIRLEWVQPLGANCPHYLSDIPTMFISLENPYHLQDVPRIKTFINAYNSNDAVLKMLVEKLLGRSEFSGTNPVDPFCNKWDTRL